MEVSIKNGHQTAVHMDGRIRSTEKRIDELESKLQSLNQNIVWKCYGALMASIAVTVSIIATMK